MKTYLPYITIKINQDIGEQLYQIAYIINFLRKSKKVNIKRKLVFLKDENNKAFNSMYEGLFNLIDKDKYESLKFTKININNEYEPDINMIDNIEFEGCIQSFDYIDKSLYDKMLSIVYNNEDIMYSAYYKYRDILDNFGNRTKDDDMVLLHISKNDLIDVEYYRKSLESVDKYNVVVFTDDIEWYSNNIDDVINKDSTYNIYFVSVNDKNVEFVLMSMFKNHIIENTSYSLWASYISYYKNKLILNP